MKKLFVVTFVLSTFILLGYSAATHAGESKKKKLYTACNIWVHNYMKCINYKMGNFIPAGTEVSHAGIASDVQNFYFIYFKVTGHKKRYSMRFRPMWHPGKHLKIIKNIYLQKRHLTKWSRVCPQRRSMR